MNLKPGDKIKVRTWLLNGKIQRILEQEKEIYSITIPPWSRGEVEATFVSFDEVKKRVLLSFPSDVLYANKSNGLQYDGWKVPDDNLRYWHCEPACLTACLIVSKSGANCLECNDWNSYAEPNLDNGKFLCYSCRSTLNWKYTESFNSSKGLNK